MADPLKIPRRTLTTEQAENHLADLDIAFTDATHDGDPPKAAAAEVLRFNAATSLAAVRTVRRRTW